MSDTTYVSDYDDLPDVPKRVVETKVIAAPAAVKVKPSKVAEVK